MTKQLLITVLWAVLITTGAFAQAADTSPADPEQRYRRALDLISAYQFERAQELLSECYHQKSGNICTFPNHAHKNQTDEETDQS